MATLYLGRLTGSDGFEKLVAIKRIHDHLAQESDFIKMFVDEARIASYIAHPNVAQVLDFGSSPHHFIAMEYVNGESLTALIRAVQPPLPICARIIAEAASGLHAAHELRGRDNQPLNVVHRDVSPHNILISYGGAVKVVDFGVARARGNLHVTISGTLKGKLAYMSPEQARMEPVDRRSDIFALGIVLYEITTRHRLFKAESEAAIVNKVLHSEIVKPSELVPDYPPALEHIVLTALQRDPDRRYENAEQMQAALEQFIVSDGAPLLQSAVARLMRSTFESRISDKQDLLRRCETIEEIADESEHSEPSLTMGGATVSVAAYRRRKRARVWSGVLFAVILVAVSGLGALLYDLFDSKRDRGDKAPATTARPDVTVYLAAKPKHALIRFAGRRVTNPYTVKMPARQGYRQVTFSAVGFRSQSLDVALATGGRYVVALERMPADAGPPPADVMTYRGSYVPRSAYSDSSVPRTGKRVVKTAQSKKRHATTKKATNLVTKKKQKRRVRRKRRKRDKELFGNPYGS
jgi:serine/threonine protein kinase